MKSIWSVTIASSRNGLALSKITVLASSVRGALQKGERYVGRRQKRDPRYGPWYISEVRESDSIQVP